MKTLCSFFLAAICLLSSSAQALTVITHNGQVYQTEPQDHYNMGESYITPLCPQ
jgi:hypothetical protein